MKCQAEDHLRLAPDLLTVVNQSRNTFSYKLVLRRRLDSLDAAGGQPVAFIIVRLAIVAD
jgi:hypothetical protein